jgi:predicted SAM-dependent methyltransferase
MDAALMNSFARKLFRRVLRRPGKSTREWMWPSETSKCRDRLAPYCRGAGLDIGFGGDPITADAIRVDLAVPYTAVGAYSVQLPGDGANLHWFADDALDFIYSSHLLEDFEHTEPILREWLRVLKPGGRLVLFCPDEQAFRRHCDLTGQPYNEHHKHSDFSLAYVKRLLEAMGQRDFIHENPLVDAYSWELVCVKRQAGLDA